MTLPGARGNGLPGAAVEHPWNCRPRTGPDISKQSDPQKRQFSAGFLLFLVEGERGWNGPGWIMSPLL
jgi:hypothetical protein